MKIESIGDQSPQLTEVQSLWRKNSATLGFMPEGGFIQYAKKRQILVCVGTQQELLGYLLYRTTRNRAHVVHLCVASAARHQGVARALVRALFAQTTRLEGVGLRCRRDFDIYQMWPKFGFSVIRELPGRAIDGSELGEFFFSHNRPNLFSSAVREHEVKVVIDANVMLDLTERRWNETVGLEADWLTECVKFYVTPEIRNDFDRAESFELRSQRRNELKQFDMVQPTHSQFELAQEKIDPVLGPHKNPRDESDSRQLAWAIASGATAFLTRDQRLLDHEDEIYNATGLSVVRPADFIVQLDRLLSERKYQQILFAGTKSIIQQRLESLDLSDLNAITKSGERQNDIRDRLLAYMAEPTTHDCFVIRRGTNTAELLAVFVTGKVEDRIELPILRVCSTPLEQSLLKKILSSVIRDAAAADCRSVTLTDAAIAEDYDVECDDLGFIRINERWVKLIVPGLHTRAEAIGVLQSHYDIRHISHLVDGLSNCDDVVVASEIEHTLWPLKLADFEMPCFIVPIRPEFADQLFDEKLAAQTLFGTDMHLALNPEAVYYRDAKQQVIRAPARILWYVSDSDKRDGTKSIRACSRAVEVCIGKPKELFKRFRRLGVYEWRHVWETAKQNPNVDVMAIRFDQTELLNPVHWQEFQEIFRTHGFKKQQLISPLKISTGVFNEIYTSTFNTSSLRSKNS